jgi:Tfp pilus assembly protein PilN
MLRSSDRVTPSDIARLLTATAGARTGKVIENLNLASQPFRNRALPWTVAVVVALVSVAALAFTLSQWRGMRARAVSVERDVQGLRAESNQLKQEAGEINGQLTDEQRRMLDAAHLIVDRRNFSWSRLLADLETTLPQGVRVSRITVRDINGSGGRARAELELAVLARTAADVTNMIGQMAGSGIFSADLLTQSQAPKGEAGIEATMRVRYMPPAGRPAGHADDNDTARLRDARPAARARVTRATAHAEAAR